ncbi:chain-length determining protein [Brevundimonas sp. 374]|uniref:chain-length determining protein n=1 Tax=Brevundimonas sp. 374 TaxID=1150400 RepID=UPI00088DCD75|nr:chain-length determining protein [Brevundimonas sp. 374]SDR06230.1 capsular polysaccharide transport system permease protein [Brevundimonas sp. 374]
MSESRLDYLGPLANSSLPRKSERWKSLPWGFLALVVFPTLISAIYFLLLASPQYVSEARFVVRTANGGGVPSAFGVALQGVGLSSAQTDAFAIHEYVGSTEAVSDLTRRYNLSAIWGRSGVDFLSRYPRLGESATKEGLQRAMKRFVVIGYDSTTGISTLRVNAFRPEDAQKISVSILNSGEELVNRLNERSTTNAVIDARGAKARAEEKLASVQAQMTNLRTKERFIDPSVTASEASRIIGTLLGRVAEIRAEREQIASEAPESPMLAQLDGRIAAYQRQVEVERLKVAGGADSLAPQVGVYEALELERKLAAEDLTQAAGALLVAEQQAKRQQLYLERIVPPSLPEEATEPKRWLAIGTIFLGLMLLYGVGWLIVAGVREHRQH